MYNKLSVFFNFYFFWDASTIPWNLFICFNIYILWLWILIKCNFLNVFPPLKQTWIAFIWTPFILFYRFYIFYMIMDFDHHYYHYDYYQYYCCYYYLYYCYCFFFSISFIISISPFFMLLAFIVLFFIILF